MHLLVINKITKTTIDTVVCRTTQFIHYKYSKLIIQIFGNLLNSNYFWLSLYILEICEHSTFTLRFSMFYFIHICFK